MPEQTGQSESMSPGLLPPNGGLNGSASPFWVGYLGRLIEVTKAESILLLERRVGSEWRAVAVAPPPSASLWNGNGGVREAQALADEAIRDGAVIKRYPMGASSVHFVASRLAVAEGEVVVTLRLLNVGDEAAVEVARRVRAEAEAPLAHELTEAAATARREAQRFAGALDLLLLLNAERHFVAAAMVLCNEAAARFACERVGLGWIAGNRVCLRAVSHGEKIDPRAGPVRALEAAMEEVLEQDAEIGWPGGESIQIVTRDHAAYAKAEGIAHLASIPFRLDGEPVAVLTLERAKPFGRSKTEDLRLLADQVTRRLEDLRLRDRWFGLRWASAIREQASKLLGVEHTGMKLLALAVTIAVLLLIFLRIPYQVEAPFTLRCSTLAQLPAPFDGYIEKVDFQIGDHVGGGQPLLSLDQRELFVQEASILAEEQKHVAEAQKAESEANVAESRIANAAADEARARLAVVRLHLEQSKVTAPFEGFVVEGDLREKIAAPVKQGDVLLQVAKIDAVYPELRIPEESIHDVAEGAAVRLAFASRPHMRFPGRVERVEPLAQPSEKGSEFVTRCHFEGAREEWWRPGMTGVAKIQSGKRSPLWILTHRTADALRLRFWWW